MKAHYNKFNKNFQKRINASADNRFIKQRDGLTRRLLKAMCVTLHQECGFGKIRSSRVINKLIEVASERDNDEVYWAHVDRYVKVLGFEFEDEDYGRLDG